VAAVVIAKEAAVTAAAEDSIEGTALLAAVWVLQLLLQVVTSAAATEAANGRCGGNC
jgi:hypothetical protein